MFPRSPGYSQIRNKHYAIMAWHLAVLKQDDICGLWTKIDVAVIRE